MQRGEAFFGGRVQSSSVLNQHSSHLQQQSNVSGKRGFSRGSSVSKGSYFENQTIIAQELLQTQIGNI